MQLRDGETEHVLDIGRGAASDKAPHTCFISQSITEDLNLAARCAAARGRTLHGSARPRRLQRADIRSAF